jgi:hypothetical protein
MPQHQPTKASEGKPDEEHVTHEVGLQRLARVHKEADDGADSKQAGHGHGATPESLKYRRRRYV